MQPNPAKQISGAKLQSNHRLVEQETNAWSKWGLYIFGTPMSSFHHYVLHRKYIYE